ncbi:MAG: sigma-70 family RNA polymerase sigma factor [Armatimonadota bacterium]|nr:sigma-70 family RNA polymerase sigma factor [Armatimonadota bacterium]MDR7454541.1 sigma-70 family RNA polymerase sigma factor [Armatimonadota bacterium]MDR7456987.1 sigma-70 family RNA polymerase sigma factor [Armatimonadota bacterium]MDR7512979.1 sigma-70 family RNA polymerase sigma factor [Armatimonadota bacterium]
MFEDYLRELQRVELLAPDEERALWRAYRHRGDAAGRLRLIEAYQPLVFKVVMSLRPPDGLLMDLIQEGAVGLIESVERFDPDRGVRFSTFASYRIRGRVLNALDRVRVEVSLDQTLAAGEDHGPLAALADPAATSALAGIEDRALLRHVLQTIERLPPRERAVLRAVVGAQPPREIAGELQISLSHFYRLQKQATDRLRALLGIEGMHQPQGA